MLFSHFEYRQILYFFLDNFLDFVFTLCGVYGDNLYRFAFACITVLVDDPAVGGFRFFEKVKLLVYFCIASYGNSFERHFGLYVEEEEQLGQGEWRVEQGGQRLAAVYALVGEA